MAREGRQHSLSGPVRVVTWLARNRAVCPHPTNSGRAGLGSHSGAALTSSPPGYAILMRRARSGGGAN